MNLPPSILRLSGKTYVGNGQIHEVHHDITMEEALAMFPPDKIEEGETFEFTSSKGDRTYTVAVRDGSYTCTCPGCGFRRKCKHVDQVKNLKNQ